MNNTEENLPPISFRKKISSNPYSPLIYALALSFGVLLGFVINAITAGKQSLLSKQYNKIDDILNYVDAKYVDTINRSQLLDKTIDGLLSNLDPHSVYVPAQDVNEMNEPLEGNFEGIGIEFSIVQDTITVVNAISGGPSELVGIKSGDRIIKINDSIVAGIKIKDTEVKHRLRGPKGSIVNVSIMRGTSGKLTEFEIKRDKIPLYSVDASYMVDKQTGYIRIGMFSSTTHKEFAEKLRELQEKGMKKLIIDLRDNTGGYLMAATSVADELISGEKLLVYTQGKSYARQDYRARTDGMFEKGDLCVLINQYSASASEILAGAIQDWDRGTIIGRTSFGKGLVQEQYDLKDGSALRLTIARYYTPSGRSIQRPYTNGKEEYDHQFYERFKSGEFLHGDSLIGHDTTVYQTSKGRKVYGGGGIHPDVFVPLDTFGGFDYYLGLSAFIPEFVYKYSSRHSGFGDVYKSPEDFKAKFVATTGLMDEFYSYATAGGFKRVPEKDHLIEAKLKLFLKAFVAKQIWRMNGYYYIVNEDDNVMKMAIEKIK
jgi:carboxyl-terminal processing protease